MESTEYLILFKLDNTVTKYGVNPDPLQWPSRPSSQTASCATVEPSNHSATPLNVWVHRDSVLLFD